MKRLRIVVILTIAVYGCKKSVSTGDSFVPRKSNTELLTAHEWQLVALTVDPPIISNGTFNSDAYSQFPDCRKDDFIKYNTNQTVIYNEGPTKCNASDPQTVSDKWAFNSGESVITEGTLQQTIIDLTDTHLKITYISELAGTHHTYTADYINK